MSTTPIMDALREAAAANPQKAMEAFGQLREQFDSLSAEEQQEAIGELTKIKDKVPGLPRTRGRKSPT